MSDPMAEDQRPQTSLAPGSVGFALCVVVSTLANDAPATATVCQIANVAALPLTGTGWLAPVLLWIYGKGMGFIR